MKNTLLIFLLFFACIQTKVAGQNKSIGIHVGVGLNGVKQPLSELYVRQYGNIIDYEGSQYDYSLFAFRLGLNKTWDLGKGFSFRSGIEYAQKGSKEKIYGVNWSQNIPTLISGTQKQYFNYFDFPFLIQYSFPGKIKYTIFGGSSLDLLFSSKFKREIFGSSGRPIRNTHLYYKVSQSLIFGTGCSFRIDDKFDFQIRMQYSSGLLNIYKDPNKSIDLLVSSFAATIGMQYFIEN